MRYKFLKPKKLTEGLLATWGREFIELWAPEVDEERYCYIDMPEQCKDSFESHFGVHLVELNYPCDYPSYSLLERINKFLFMKG